MKSEKNSINIAVASIEKNFTEIEEILDRLHIKKRRLLALGEPTEEVDSIILNALKVLPLKKTKQGYLASILKEGGKYSQIEKQIDLIFFKRILRKDYGLTVSPGGNDKLLDMKFADALDIPVPSVYQENVMFDELNFKGLPFVLKPTYGANANNVFYVWATDRIVEVKSTQNFNSIKDLKNYIDNSGYKKTWQTEQLMTDTDGKPSTDLKVYAYYGETGGVMEVLREDKTYRCWYSPEGKILESENLKTEWFNGNGFNPKLLEYASKIALATPTPFLRIDFYQDADEYYLGEITPHPGKYYTEYSDQVDSQLGRCFVEAEARLFADLVKGKKFNLYFDIYKGYLK
ncbi:ATP-grasp fold amidoligase family protein [Psychrobacter immobilis]|uniref:ATP-grasp fold amidoligase family protein n=1 Tax=Psychrobacter immobilis TaxID=498 RepID=UPI0028E59868|nr:ATP-grasp fold amidoligase family protein [Psychrobacter immobilis]